MEFIKNLLKIKNSPNDKKPTNNFKNEAELDEFLTIYVNKKLRNIWVQRLYLLIPWLIHALVLGTFIGMSFIWIEYKDKASFSIGKFLYWFLISLSISALLRLLTVTVNMFSRVKYNDKKMRKVAPKIISQYFMFKDKSLKDVKVIPGKFKPLFRKTIKKIEITTNDRVFSYDLREKPKFSFLLFLLGFFVKFVKLILKYIRVFKGSFLKSKIIVSQEVKINSVGNATKSKFQTGKKKLEAEGYSLKKDVLIVKRKKTTWSQKGLQVTDIQIHARHKPEMKPEIYKIMDEKLTYYKEVITKLDELTY